MLNIPDEISPNVIYDFSFVSNLRERTLQWCILELDYSHNKHILNSSLKRAQDRRTCEWVEKVSSSPYFECVKVTFVKSESLTCSLWDIFSHKNDKTTRRKYTLMKTNLSLNVSMYAAWEHHFEFFGNDTNNRKHTASRWRRRFEFFTFCESFATRMSSLTTSIDTLAF